MYNKCTCIRTWGKRIEKNAKTCVDTYRESHKDQMQRVKNTPPDLCSCLK